MFGNDSRFGCMLDRFLDKFWYACLDTFGAIIFGQICLCMFEQIWTGFGMYVWALLVHFLIPKQTFNHFDYFLTDLFMLV